MDKIWKSLPLMLVLAGCSTLNESIQLGGAIGSIAGGGATYAGYSAAGKSPSLGAVAIGAGVGAGIGVLTSYFTHRAVESDRASCQVDQTEMHFGDLPPSPFLVPKTQLKKGSRQ